jgi:hypothetical protein
MMNMLSPSHLKRSPWVHFLGGPVIWGIHFIVSYVWVEFACRANLPMLDSTILGLTVLSWIVLIFTFVAVLASLYVGWVSYRAWHRIQKSHGTDELEAWGVESRRFMAFTGMFLSALFSLVILLTGLPALVLGPCV